jgi:hypothetical protein
MIPWHWEIPITLSDTRYGHTQEDTHYTEWHPDTEWYPLHWVIPIPWVTFPSPKVLTTHPRVYPLHWGTLFSSQTNRTLSDTHHTVIFPDTEWYPSHWVIFPDTEWYPSHWVIFPDTEWYPSHWVIFPDTEWYPLPWVFQPIGYRTEFQPIGYRTDGRTHTDSFIYRDIDLILTLLTFVTMTLQTKSISSGARYMTVRKSTKVA